MLNNDGSITTPKNPWRVGDVFVVDKQSGDVSGKNAPMLDMTVLSVGDDKDYAWKGISTRVLKRVIESANSRSGVVSSAGNGLDALWISTFEKGPNKPFIYYDETAVFTGICTVF
jgi:hypothetical protein